MHHETVFEFFQKSVKYYFETDTDWLYQDITCRKEIFNQSKLKHHQTEIDYALSNRNQPINIFVVGEGNFGKSTLINSILKKEIAEVNFLPNTWAIHKYGFGNKNATIYYEDGKTTVGSFDNIKSILKQEENKHEANNSYISQIFRVDWFYDDIPLLKNYTIVDTPGLAQLRTLKSNQTIEDFYYQADCVFWLLDTGRINSENTNKYINKMSRFSKKVIGIINKWDKTKNGIEKERILNQAKVHFGKNLSMIIPVSAKTAWENLNNELKYKESNIPELLIKADEMFLRNKKQHRNTGLYFLSNVVFTESSNILSHEKAVILNNIEIYNKNKNLVKDYQTRAKTEMSRILVDITGSNFESICDNINTQVTAGNAENYVNNILLRDEHVNSIFQSAIKNCIAHRDQLYYELIQMIVSEQYTEVQYDKDGSVLSKQDIPNLSQMYKIDTFNQFSVRMTIKISGMDKFLSAISWIPFLGKYIDPNPDIRRRITNQVRNQVISHNTSIRSVFEQNIQTNFLRILECIVEQFNLHFESEYSYNSKLNRISRHNNMAVIEDLRFGKKLLNLLKKKEHNDQTY